MPMGENPYRAPQASDNTRVSSHRRVRPIEKMAMLEYLALAVSVRFWICLFYFASWNSWRRVAPQP